MDERNAAIEFVKEHKPSSYSFDEFVKLLNKLGFAVEDVHSERAKTFYSLLDIEAIENDDFFLCNKNGIKVVFINTDASDDVKCHKIATLFFLMESENSRLCSDDEFVSANRFAVYLKDALSEGLSLSDKYVLIQKYGKIALTAILCIFVIILGMFINNASDTSQNPLNGGTYISHDFVNDSVISVDAFAQTDDNSDGHALTDNIVENKSFEISDQIISETQKKHVVHDTEDLTAEDYSDKVTSDNIKIDSETDIHTKESDETEINDPMQVEDFDSKVDETGNEATHLSQPETSLIEENINDAAPASDISINSEDVYYVTKSGKKYHISSCSYIKDLSQCTPIKKEDILLYSYEPCKRCIK